MKDTGIRRLLDVRLNNASRLAGFARRADLPFFLERLCSAEYLHEPRLAPTREILDAYRNGGGWPGYERAFLDLLRGRKVEETLPEHAPDEIALLRYLPLPSWKPLPVVWA